MRSSVLAAWCAGGDNKRGSGKAGQQGPGMMMVEDSDRGRKRLPRDDTGMAKDHGGWRVRPSLVDGEVCESDNVTVIENDLLPTKSQVVDEGAVGAVEVGNDVALVGWSKERVEPGDEGMQD